MKKEFSGKWKASRQTRKQRKYLANAPQHIKQKIFSSHLSKELRQRHGRRSFQLKKGDTVKVMRGKLSGRTGKVSVVDITRMKVAIEGIQVTKKEGTKVNTWFNPSKLQIIELNLEDKRRLDSIKKQAEEKK